MVPWKRLKTFVKGYEFSDEKMGSTFGFDELAEPGKVGVFVRAIIKTALDDEGYEALAVARRVHDKRGDVVFVLVLDDDEDLKKLRERALPKPLHPSIEKIMIVLDGPDVYEPII